MNKKMYFLLSLLLIITTSLKAQVVIGTSPAEPVASAVLDLNSGISGNLGLLLPRAPLTSETDAVTIPGPATGLMVYADGVGGLSAGVYIWNGAKWKTNESNGTVTVPDPVNSFDLVPPTQDVVRWQTGTTIAAGNFNGGAAATLPYVSWKVISGADNISNVTTTLNTYAFTAAKKGTTVVRATSLDGNHSEDATIHVTYTPVEVITVTAPTYSDFLLTGKNLPMEKELTPANPTRPDVTWSQDFSGGSITTAGVLNIPSITAPATEATVTVTASAQDDSGVTGTKEITVHQAVTGITISTTSPSSVPNATTTASIELVSVLPDNAYDKSFTWNCDGCTNITGNNTSATATLSVGSNVIRASSNDGSGLASNYITIDRLIACSGVVSNGRCYKNHGSLDPITCATSWGVGNRPCESQVADFPDNIYLCVFYSAYYRWGSRQEENHGESHLCYTAD